MVLVVGHHDAVMFPKESDKKDTNLSQWLQSRESMLRFFLSIV